MIRAALLTVWLICTAGFAFAQESLRDRFQSASANTATSRIPDRMKDDSFCDRTDLDTISDSPWETSTLLGVTGLSGMMGGAVRFDPSRPGGYDISAPDPSGTRTLTHREVDGFRRILRPMSFADLNMEEQIDGGQTLGYLLGDLSIETASGCPANRLPVFEILDGRDGVHPGRIGYVFFLTSTLGYELSGASSRSDGSGPPLYKSSILMR
ncbi:hypothetical protein [Jannaschia donghaensis]|uniref:Uncharacterized protein n=1 Tax=Jannaschia donghaensis TaxID=420998 RepID=A0A0M6YK98_9RHOB|nr:hypothetical protein [Jannaschia donghaensis]CTQ50782.1 hypothetical protein JDO7802_02811 [Jannaschia donghaensis]